MSDDLITGRRGEDLAHRFLQDAGLVIVGRNFRLPSGDSEIDIVARDGDELVMVEVKTRRSADFGPPERAVGPEKRAHIQRAARVLAIRTGVPFEMVRFDVVSVILGAKPEITHWVNAFSWRRR